MSINHNPLHASPQRAFNLQKYLLLHSQHNALHTHLATLLATPSAPTSPTGDDSTLPSVPSSTRRRGSSLPPSYFAPHAESDEVLEEERKLTNVNQQIKATLTELLNCDSVRQDRLYSVWVQSRLMDAERELKEGRRHSIVGEGSRRGSWEVAE